MAERRYEIRVTWTGDRGCGTSAYRDHDRDHPLQAAAKPRIEGSS